MLVIFTSLGTCTCACCVRPSGSLLHKLSTQVFFFLDNSIFAKGYGVRKYISIKLFQLPRSVLQPLQLRPPPPSILFYTPLHSCLWPPWVALQWSALQWCPSLQQLAHSCLQHPCICLYRGRGGGVGRCRDQLFTYCAAIECRSLPATKNYLKKKNK